MRFRCRVNGLTIFKELDRALKQSCCSSKFRLRLRIKLRLFGHITLVALLLELQLEENDRWTTKSGLNLQQGPHQEKWLTEWMNEQIKINKKIFWLEWIILSVAFIKTIGCANLLYPSATYLYMSSRQIAVHYSSSGQHDGAVFSTVSTQHEHSNLTSALCLHVHPVSV